MDLFCFDAEYLRRLRAADPSVEEHFADYFSKLMTIKLRARRASGSEIDEVIQETFFRVLRALRSPNTLRNADRLGPFVNSVCNNVWFEVGRIKRKSEQLADDFDGPVLDDDVVTLLVSAEEQKAVLEVLETLEEKDKRLLRSLFIDERPKDEICAELDISRDYFRVLLHRALKQFRRRYLEKIDRKPEDDDSR